MAIYPTPLPREKLDVFFGEFFREMRKAPPQSYGNFFMRAEEEFRRAGYRDKISSGVENILIVRLDAIGDIILTSAFIREVRANFPKAHITLVVTPIAAPMVEFCPYVNEMLSLDKKSLFGNLPEVMEKIAVFCRENLWQKHFSIAFSPRWDFDTLPALLTCWLSGARERIGYCVNPFRSWLPNPPPNFAPQFGFLLTKDVVTPQSVISEIEKHFYLLKAAGLKINQRHMELWYGAEDFRYAATLLEDLPKSSKKVTLGIGGSAPTKKYPVEKYLVALKKLAKKNLVFVIVGGREEIDDAKFIEQNLPRGKVLNLVGKTTVRQTEAVISQTDFYLGNDTGTLHMAAAAQVPVLIINREAQDRENILPALFSPFSRFAPWQTKKVILRPVRPLDDCATSPPVYGLCRHLNIPHCITQITPQEIIAGFETLEKF